MIIKTGKHNSICFEKENFLLLNRYLKKNRFSKIFILADTNTFLNCYPLLAQNCEALQHAEIIEIEPGEENKSIENCMGIWQTLTEAQADKQALLLNLGGGVVCDLGGFAASTYKRGISFIHVPTSLMAMADASVGGKCGIDFMGIKNNIGSIIQPDAVFIQPVFLNTLPQRHLKNGLAEIIKMAFISDAGLQTILLDKKTRLDNIIKTSVIRKWEIVKKDPLDKNIRQSLNFGHTFGHAIESALLLSKKELLHGEAIAIGMLLEGHISLQLKLITKNHFQKLQNMIVPYYGMPKFNQAELKKVQNFMLQDKKNKDSEIRMSLIEGIAGCRIQTTVTRNQINCALEFYRSIQ
jgi:3-dehydroquinate synthase